MNSLADTTTLIFSYATLFAQIGIVFATIVLVLVIMKHPNRYLHHMVRKSADHMYLLGFIVSFGALVSSMFYSNIIGFDPCELCWWQRVFIYPQAVLFAVAYYNEKKNKIQDEMVFIYSLVLSLCGALIAIFQYYGQMFNPELLAMCETQGSSCSKIFFVSFGYITIPMMSLTAYLILILFFFSRRHYTKNK
jgi:disulfide bond formation protein DsbB